MAKILNKSQIHLSDTQLKLLWRYHNWIRNRNQDRDLTRIVGFNAMIIKHYVDSMIVGNYWTLPSPLVDVGTGAGFPGIPIKIRYPHLALTLAEPRPKRIDFLKEVVADLKLRDVTIFEHKVVSRSFQSPVKGVITRALEPIEKTILRTSGSLVPGGQLIFLKGPSVDPEISQAEGRFKGAYRLLHQEAYRLPHTPHERRLVVFERLEGPTL